MENRPRIRKRYVVGSTVGVGALGGMTYANRRYLGNLALDARRSYKTGRAVYRGVRKVGVGRRNAFRIAKKTGGAYWKIARLTRSTGMRGVLRGAAGGFAAGLVRHVV